MTPEYLMDSFPLYPSTLQEDSDVAKKKKNLGGRPPIHPEGKCQHVHVVVPERLMKKFKAKVRREKTTMGRAFTELVRQYVA